MRAAPTTGEQPGGSDNPKADRAAAKAYAKAQRPFWKKKRVIIPAAFVGLAIFGTAVGGGGSNTANTTAIKSEAPAATAPAATAPAQPAETSGQRNARQAAENYLSISAFSRKGLIEQLSSAAGDQYTLEEATFGANNALAK